jgi:hypothetical protein
MKKLAIIFYGQPRFIDNKDVYEQYIKLINLYNADVYIHSWISDKESKMEASDWANTYNFTEKINSAEQLLMMYKPKKVLFEQPEFLTFEVKTRDIVKDLEYYTLNNEKNLLSHLASLTRSINLLDTSDLYDFLLITRLDAYIFDFPNLNELDKEKFYLDDRYNHWPDISFLIGNKYKKAFDIYNNIDFISNKICKFTAEEYKKQNYLNFFDINDVILLKNLKVGLVRSNDGLSKIQI